MTDTAVENTTTERYHSSVPSAGRKDLLAVSGSFPHTYLLVFRYVLINIVGFALLFTVWNQGYIDSIIETDSTWLCHLIFGVFLIGHAVCSAKIWKTSRELNACKNISFHPDSRAAKYVAETTGKDSGSRSILAANLRLKLSSRVSIVRHLSSSLVLLGLIGTVVGFIISLGGVDPDKAGDASSIAPMITTLIEGMSVALYTTLVGGVLNVWLNINYNMLTTGTVNLITDITALGERHES